MNKLNRIFFAVTIAILTISCTAKDYTLKGKVNNDSLNGVTINLRTYTNGEWINSGEQTINNNQFEFKGVADQPVMALLAYNNAEKSLRGAKLFILENAKIKFVIDEGQNIKVEGTQQNNLIQAFDEEMENVAPTSVIDSLQNNLYTQDETNRIIESLMEKQEKIIVDFTTKSVNTLAGTAVFIDNANEISIDNKLAVLSLMNDQTKQNPLIQSIAQQVEVQQRTAVGRPYIDFTLPDTDGNNFSLSQMVGKTNYVLIDFWASWCGPCIRSFPELTAFYNEYKGSNLEILGVSLDRDEQSWKTAIEKHGLIWKHVSDLNFWQSEAAQLYGVNSIPATVLIDREGKIIGRNMSITKIKEIILNN